MRGGFSGAKGFMLYDTESDLAVYGSENGIQVGSVNEMKQLVSSDDKSCKKSDKKYDQLMGGLLLFIIVTIILTKIFGSFLLFLSVLVFCVLSYFSILVIFFAWTNVYKDEETFMQFRRYHGAEHASIRLVLKNEEITVENLMKQSHFDAECGTAYAGAWTMLSLIISILIYLFPNIGLWKFILYLLISLILLMVNVINPLNPFKLLQYKAVLKPTEKEYRLGIEVIKEFYRVHEKNLSE